MYAFPWGPGARTPGTPGGQQIYMHLRGAQGPVRQGPREINMHLCGVRGPVGQGPRRSSPAGPGPGPVIYADFRALDPEAPLLKASPLGF